MGLASYSSDSATNPGLPIDKLDKFLDEIRFEPVWRREADLDASYYDGNQLDAQTLQDMERLGMAPLIRNLIRPTIDVALGMEAKTRSDWRVQADNDEQQDMAEAMSAKIKEAERESGADRACSDAYVGQLKTGLAWVEVSRELDPFRYPYLVSAVNRKEIFWDWSSKKPDLSDARYLVRKRWQDCDILELMFPDDKQLIEQVGFSRANWDTPITDVTAMQGRTWLHEQASSLPESEWRDTTRKRLCLYEVWYRVWQRGFVIRTPDGRTVEVDLNNERHAEAVAAGVVEPVPAIFPKVRLSWWIGPPRIADLPTPYRHSNFPYIPFWGYREDLTQIPYGLIRSMRSPQDEINARLSKMMWLMSAKRAVMDASQVDDIDEFRREIARPDAVIILSQRRKSEAAGGIFKVDDQMELSKQQFMVMQDAMEAIQKTAGVYQAMLGEKQKGGATSGIAINSLVEQGTTTLAEINDNYRFGRRGVGQALAELLVEDMGSQPRVVNVNEKFGAKKRQIILNNPVIKNGIKMLDNDIQRTMIKVALEDVPSTPTYRAQQLMMLTEMTKAMPPQIQAFVVPFILEASEMPHRREIADQVRKALGIDSGEQDQSFTKDQVQQIVQQEIERFVQQSELGLKRKEVDIKASGLVLAEKDSETKRLLADARVKKDVADTDLKVLDTLLAHDAAVDRGGKIASERAA